MGETATDRNNWTDFRRRFVYLCCDVEMRKGVGYSKGASEVLVILLVDILVVIIHEGGDHVMSLLDGPHCGLHQG